MGRGHRTLRRGLAPPIVVGAIGDTNRQRPVRRLNSMQTSANLLAPAYGGVAMGKPRRRQRCPDLGSAGEQGRPGGDQGVEGVQVKRQVRGVGFQAPHEVGERRTVVQSSTMEPISRCAVAALRCVGEYPVRLEFPGHRGQVGVEVSTQGGGVAVARLVE
jgi:hypothetical protein